MVRWNNSVYRALRPGGIYIVADHRAEIGSGDRDSAELHRIDPGLIKSEVLAAGFVLVEEGDIFRNPDDDHKHMIMDPVVRGRTDRVLLKFRKPDRS